jgi:hypothetical protein
MANHFILTRFNLPLWNFDKTGSKARTDEWLEERFELFERYCLPSVAKQTCKNFVWLVLFDENTPNRYKTKISNYAKKCAQFKAYYLSAEESKNYISYFSQIIKMLADKESKQIITTRLDNDDAINIDCISEIQSQIEKEHINVDFCLSFQWGLQYFEKWNYIHKIRFPNNHFITFVENEISNLKNIYSIAHLDVAKQQRFVKIRNKKMLMWIEVIHDKNASNDVKIKNIQYPFYSSRNLSAFGFDCIHTSSIKNILFFFLKFIPRLFIYTLSHNRLFGWKDNEVK